MKNGIYVEYRNTIEYKKKYLAKFNKSTDVKKIIKNTETNFLELNIIFNKKFWAIKSENSESVLQFTIIA